MTRIAHTSCRICAGQCGLRYELDDSGRVLSVRGDESNPATQGYVCSKGATLHHAHQDPARLRHPLKRARGGEFVRVRPEQALDEIAERLRAIIAGSGPDAVAGFRGTMNYSNLVANHLLPEWLRCLGSTSFYSTMTVDQSAKWVTFERLGGWAGGRDPFASADVLLWVGTNPLVSLSTFNFDLQNPVRRLRDARARGLKLVVIDPRRTESARHADVFLQPYPGEDVTVLAGLLNLVFLNRWHDADFCARHVSGVERLAAAVAPYTPDYVSFRAGVDPATLTAAAAMFAEPLADRRKRGSAASGTGPNMGPHSNLAEHLVESLNVVCGRYARAGDPVANPGVLGPPYPRRAQVIPPGRGWERGPASRVRGLGRLFGEKMSGALADEILTPGPGQVRALIVDGGNPVIALPEQARTERALRALDLLVVIDPFMTPTAALAHYVLPPVMMLERHDLGSRDYETHTMLRPYAQYAEPVLQPPQDAELVEDWHVFYELARRLDVPLTLDGVPLDMSRRPSSEDLLRLLTRGSQVPFGQLRAATRGRVFDVPHQWVEPEETGCTARFAVAPPDVLDELQTVRAEDVAARAGGFRLAVRRLRDVQNTMYHSVEAVARRVSGNTAHMHPDDLDALRLGAGDDVEIVTRSGVIRLPVVADDSVRPGVVSVPHGWGDLVDPPMSRVQPVPGVNTNVLTSATLDCEPINAMPCLTGLRIDVRAAPLSSSRERPS